MKKTSVISIFIVFLLSIVIVGFFGVRMKVYDPIIYVSGITWDSSEFEKDKVSFFVKKYTEEEKEEQSIDFDARLDYYLMGFNGPIELNIKCRPNPENATNPNLNYYFDNTGKDVQKAILPDNTVDIMFNEPVGITLYVASTDGRNVTYTIRINVIDESSIFPN